MLEVLQRGNSSCILVKMKSLQKVDSEIKSMASYIKHTGRKVTFTIVECEVDTKDSNGKAT